MLFHGASDRSVNDLDIWIDSKRDNALRCFDALRNIAPGAFPFPAECLAVRGKKIDLRNLRYDAEIFTSMDGPVSMTHIPDGARLNRMASSYP